MFNLNFKVLSHLRWLRKHVNVPPNSYVTLNEGLEVPTFLNGDRNQTYLMDEDQMLNL